MQIKVDQASETEVSIFITAADKDLAAIKQIVLSQLQKNTRVAGFRAGKAPLHLVEKQTDQTKLSDIFLEEAIPKLCELALKKSGIRPIMQPIITITKFVPFTTLEFRADAVVLGKIVLPNYRKIKKTKPVINTSAKDINDVLAAQQKRLATKKDVDRKAEKGDEVWIDFEGTDQKKQPIAGADGRDYPLILGSDTFIPGFELKLLGTKSGESLEFTLPFPKDYNIQALAGQKVTFNVKVNKVLEVILPPIDDSFAKQVGPFQTLNELKADVKKHLSEQKHFEADRALETDIIKQIVEKTKIALPAQLLDRQVDGLFADLQKRLSEQGSTYDQFLTDQNKTDEAYRKEVLKIQAIQQLKAGLVLAEIASTENISVSPEELRKRIDELKKHYQDPQMQLELTKPGVEREIANRILTEKTLAKVLALATET